jgi:predicted O-methyltransferase YrrM
MRRPVALRRNRSDARRDHSATIERAFSDITPDVLDAYFENFGFTLTLSFTQLLTELCTSRKLGFVLEVGAGISTLALSSALAPHGGLLVSLEQNPEWIVRTRERLRHPEAVEFVAVPPCADGTAFDHRAVLRIAAHWRPDLVLVDGPANERFGPRALELYDAMLTPNCIVAIDDTDRGENAAAATRLATQLGLEQRDFADPIFPNHRFTLLLPPECRLPPSAAIPV